MEVRREFGRYPSSRNAHPNFESVHGQMGPSHGGQEAWSRPLEPGAAFSCLRLLCGLRTKGLGGEVSPGSGDWIAGGSAERCSANLMLAGYTYIENGQQLRDNKSFFFLLISCVASVSFQVVIGYICNNPCITHGGGDECVVLHGSWCLDP